MNLHYRATVGQKSYISVPHRKTQIFPPCWTDTSNHDVVWRGLFSCTSRTPSKCCSGQTSGQTSVGLSEEPINRGRSLTSAAHSPDSPGATHPLTRMLFVFFSWAFNTAITNKLTLKVRRTDCASVILDSQKRSHPHHPRWSCSQEHHRDVYWVHSCSPTTALPLLT